MPIDREALAEHIRFFEELGVSGYRKDAVWAGRPDRTESKEPRAESKEPAENNPILELAAIREDIGDCTRCKLCNLGRKQIVFGVGNPNADLMFVGEAPGRDEDIQGIPFVGRAGQKLTQIIEAIGLKRDDVYIANVIKCRPPENRNPEPDEVEQCEPFLFRQIDTIKPKVIVALGTFAAKSLLKTTESISRLRGRVYDYRGREARADVPPRVPASQSQLPARGVGGHEKGPRAARRRKRSVIRCAWFRSPSPFPFSTF